MGTTPWVLISVAILLVLFLILAIIFKKGCKRPPDYYAFFIMGIIWLALGIPFKNYTLSIIGLVFAVVGLVNKKKWKENRQCWGTLTPEEKKWKTIILVILGILVFAGLVFLLLNRTKIA